MTDAAKLPAFPMLGVGNSPLTPGRFGPPVDRFDDFPPPRREPPSGVLANVTAAMTPAARRPPHPAPATEGQRRRHRRNLLICLGARHGLSQRFLADATGLPKSRIGEILAEYRHAAITPIDEGD